METLSAREIEILQLLANGLDTRDIADELNLSYNTVRAHRNNILRKTDARNIIHAVSLAIKAGII